MDLGENMSNQNEFQSIFDRSYDIAVKYRHEYVVVETLLQALLEVEQIKKMISQLGGDIDSINSELDSFFKNPKYHSFHSTFFLFFSDKIYLFRGKKF